MVSLKRTRPIEEVKSVAKTSEQNSKEVVKRIEPETKPSKTKSPAVKTGTKRPTEGGAEPPVKKAKKPDLGKKISKYSAWFRRKDEPPNAGNKPLPVGKEWCLSGYRFCITGILDSLTRAQCTGLIQQYGGLVASSVSGLTAFLVAGTEPSESKIRKAKERKVKIIDEDELFEIIETRPAGNPIRVYESQYGRWERAAERLSMKRRLSLDHAEDSKRPKHSQSYQDHIEKALRCHEKDTRFSHWYGRIETVRAWTSRFAKRPEDSTIDTFHEQLQLALELKPKSGICHYLLGVLMMPDSELLGPKALKYVSGPNASKHLTQFLAYGNDFFFGKVERAIFAKAHDMLANYYGTLFVKYGGLDMKKVRRRKIGPLNQAKTSCLSHADLALLHNVCTDQKESCVKWIRKIDKDSDIYILLKALKRNFLLGPNSLQTLMNNYGILTPGLQAYVKMQYPNSYYALEFFVKREKEWFVNFVDPFCDPDFPTTVTDTLLEFIYPM